jgi:hypothetical protein
MTLAVLLFAQHVMGQAADAVLVHDPAALVGAGAEDLDGLGDRQRPRRGGWLPLPQLGVAVQQPLGKADQEPSRDRLCLREPRR